LHELFSPLPSWIVNNTAPPVPLQTAPVAVLDDELLALIVRAPISRRSTLF
jgi:hypothetical protein